MKKNIFSGLEGLGFDDIHNIDLFSKKESSPKEETKSNKADDITSQLYDATVTCPVCGSTFGARSVKISAIRRKDKDTDFFIRYASINPYFYEVYLCNECGYAALKYDFDKIGQAQIELVKQKISSKWNGRKYPEVYDINIAIERYKLSLLNSVIIDSKSSKKAINCLRLAWMYRLLKDDSNEKIFLSQALEGFTDAYMNETFPIAGMDKFTIIYLIGELNRRIGNFNEALLWFSRVITTPNVNPKIKDLARDQRDLIKEEIQSLETPSVSSVEEKKSGFFSRFFK